MFTDFDQTRRHLLIYKMAENHKSKKARSLSVVLVTGASHASKACSVLVPPGVALYNTKLSQPAAALPRATFAYEEIS